MPIARIYCRLSKEDRDKADTSIPNQKSIGIRHCDHIGAELDSHQPFYIAIDEKSWTPLNKRRILQQAYNDSIYYDVLIVKDWQRFARGRNREDLEFKFKEAGVIISPALDSTDELSKDTSTFIGSIIIKESRRKALEMQKNKIGQGLPIGKPPYGYKYGKKIITQHNKRITVSDGVWHIDHSKSQIVKKAYQMTNDGLNWKQICKVTELSKNQYYRIIRDPSYIGYVQFNRKIRDPEGNIVRLEKNTYKSIHQPIIDQKTWEKINPKKSFHLNLSELPAQNPLEQP